MKIIAALLFFVFALSVSAQDMFNTVLDYGAVSDGSTLNTKAIQKAIDECSNNGGGTVEFPAGTYLSGTIFMKSNVVLNLQPGCTILGSKNLEDYPLYLHQPEKNIDKILLYRALIWGNQIENVGITGFGIIDGQGKNFHGIKIRPRLLMFDSCKNVNIEGITLQHPGAWTQHYLQCDGVTIRDIKIYAHGGENNDMVDIDQSRNVIITGLVGDSDDDGITLKSPGDQLVENVVISDCIIRTRTNAIKLGTESYGGFRDITITNCTISPSKTIDGFSGANEGFAGVALEIVDGGLMENIVISNLVIEKTTAPIFIRLGNRAAKYSNANSRPIGSMKNISISNIIASNASKTGCSIVGEVGHFIKNVSISNVRINFIGGGTLSEGLAEKPELINEYPECIRLGILPAYGFFVRHVDGIIFRDVELTYNTDEHRPAMLFNDVENLKLFNFAAKIADDALGQLVLQNTRNVFVNGCSPNTSNIFLRIEQNSEKIYVVGNNLSNVKKPIAIDETINTNELNIAPNLTRNSTLFEFLQPNIERDSLGMVNIYYPNNADIYFTTDGSQPTKSSKKYSKAFEQISSSTISAIAFEDDITSSTAFLELNRLQVLSPRVFPADQYFYKEIEVNLTSHTKGAKIYYTTDGSKPDKTSSNFTKPINIQKTSNLRAIAIKDGYKSSGESFTKYESLEKFDGVQYKYYESRWAKLPDFINLTPLRIGVIDKFTLADLKNRGSDFGLVMHGFLDIKNSGYYKFFASTNDGSRLLVDNREIINNDGAHPTIEKSGTVYLEKGTHLIEVRYFQAGGGKDLKISYEGPEIEKQEIPAGVLVR